jgi:hypothetical protein
VAYNATEHDEIILEMQLQKALQRDKNGDVIFVVEASNENLDLDGQKTLQTALLKTKDYFMKNGVISKDHKHRIYHEDTQTFDFDEDFIIGQPLDVFTKGSVTFVKGKLFKNNKYAQKIINLLEEGASCVRASVGGLVPRVKKEVLQNGEEIGKVVSVLWDDLALTIQPVNHTVGSAISMTKSLTSVEFVKAFSAGYGTDAATFTGGRALQGEDTEDEKILNDKVVASLVEAIANGDVADEGEAETFLTNLGISSSGARDVVRAVCKKSNLFMEVFPMAKENESAWDKIQATLNKAFGSGAGSEKEEPESQIEEPASSDYNEEDYENAGPIIKALSDQMEVMQDTIITMAKAQNAIMERLEKSEIMQKSIGQGVLALMERADEAPNPRKGVTTQLEAQLAKSMSGGGTVGGGGGSGMRLKPFTPESFNVMRDIIIKATDDGEIDMVTSGRFQTQMNKSMGQKAFPFSQDFVDFAQRKSAKAS